MPEENSRATKLVKTPEKEGSKAKQPVQKQAAIIRLNKGKADTLDSFASNDKYKTEFQRYPELRQKMEAQAVAWISRDTGGSFVLALQKIYEEQVIACFFQSQADANSAHGVSAEQLQTAVNGWKKQAEDFGKLVNLGKPVYSQDLQKIWDSLKHKQSPMQLANVAVEKFMQRPEVQEECRNDRAMQTDFNRRIESWLANGGHSTDPEVAVREIYHTTLIEHFQKERVLGNAGGESLIAVSILVFEAANKWSNTNPGQVLTTPILAGFLNTSVSPRQ
jgi:hypothetical protein